MKASVGVNLIDGTGGPVISDAAIGINEDRIKAAGPRSSVTLPPNTELISVSGLTVLPGLIDCHGAPAGTPVARRRCDSTATLLADR
jgi:imidazolonepropionase-like amidohydrolase